MAKSLIKSWKKLVPESSDKKEKEKEKKEEKKEEKEKPAPKSSFTPNSFSGAGSFSFAHVRTAIKIIGITCCDFVCAGEVATIERFCNCSVVFFGHGMPFIIFFIPHFYCMYRYCTAFLNDRWLSNFSVVRVRFLLIWSFGCTSILSIFFQLGVLASYVQWMNESTSIRLARD